MLNNLYWLCKELKLPNFLKDQILRASSSIALTLAEGSGKRTPADQRRMKGRYGADRLERACEILLRHGRTKPSVKDVERMIKSPNLADQSKAVSINRKPKTHLRGQTSFTIEGENNYESTTESNGSVPNGVVAQGDQGIPGTSY